MAIVGSVDHLTFRDNIYEIVPEIAPLFQETESYDVGDWVVYEAKLYKFISSKSAGVWDATKVDGPSTIMEEISQMKADLEAFVNLSSGKYKNIPMSRSGSASDLSVVYKYGKVKINGTIANNNVVLEADSDITAIKEGIPYRQGINSGLISDNASARKIPIEAGRYRVVFNMLSGSVTKGGVTYTDNNDFGSTNVVNAFLLKPDATTQSYTLSKTNVTAEVDLSVTQLGMQVLYCYSGCSFTDAVFELYLEKVG